MWIFREAEYEAFLAQVDIHYRRTRDVLAKKRVCLFIQEDFSVDSFASTTYVVRGINYQYFLLVLMRFSPWQN